MLRQVGWLVGLLALGALGIWIAAPDWGSVERALERLRTAPLAAGAVLVGGALGLVITEAIRIRVIGRLIGADIGWRDSVDAAVANQVMTAVTPTVGLGEPSVAYVLRKRGIAMDIAVAVPFIKFATSLALVFAIGTALVIVGFGPPVAGLVTGGALAVFATIAVVTGLFVAVCAHPERGPRFIAAVTGWLGRRRRLQRWRTRIDKIREIGDAAVGRLAGLRGVGAGGLLLLTLVHLVYYLAYVAPLVVLACVLADPPLVTLTLRSLVFLCFMFAAPTPGGAGASEAAAGLFFADLVPVADAIAIVAVFRASTFYLQLAIGVTYVSLRALMSR